MVDRVYKQSIPEFRKELTSLKGRFRELDSRTDWTKLRIEPLLDHLAALERRLGSEEFSHEFSRLRRGVEMFHSDLVYFQTNLKGLEKLLPSKSHSRRRE